jgi:hypothetical protein
MLVLLNFMKFSIFFYVVLIALLICIPMAITAAIIDSRGKRQLLDWGVERAYSIASHQGWVSPHRMMTQCHLTKSLALTVLLEACKRGLLYQHVNGRYYLAPVGPDHRQTAKNDDQRRLIEANRWRDSLD